MLEAGAGCGWREMKVVRAGDESASRERRWAHPAEPLLGHQLDYLHANRHLQPPERQPKAKPRAHRWATDQAENHRVPLRIAVKIDEQLPYPRDGRIDIDLRMYLHAVPSLDVDCGGVGCVTARSHPTRRFCNTHFTLPKRISHLAHVGCAWTMVPVQVESAKDIEISQVSAVVVASDGAPPLDSLLEELRREVLEVSAVSIDRLELSDGPDEPVVLLWLPANAATELYERAVQWAGARRPRAGLLGCAGDGSTADAERALAAGFDDFVAGRVSSRELAARLRAVHRRVHWPGLRRPGRLRYGQIMLNTDGHELWIEGRSVVLTGTELSVFRALIRARGKTLTRTEILDKAWGDTNLEISERAVDNVVLRLRRKIGRSDLIQTVRGVGFRLATD